MNSAKRRILVAMSGGVDSSVAACLLKEQGHHVVGLTMCLGMESSDGTGKKCCSPEAISDARRVCDLLDIPHYVMNFSDEFERIVVQPFIREYLNGRTPNPCVTCNQLLKFGSLLQKARAMGMEYIATGHYALLEHTDAGPVLLRADDPRKDQSYFLYRIQRNDLAHILFPLGNLAKPRVREIAHTHGLPIAEKQESQDICFVDSGSYRNLIDESSALPPGDIVDINGTVLGRHTGIHNYTIGQRRGLGISSDRPLYVIALDTSENRVVVGSEEHLYSSELEASDLNLLVDALPESVSARVRYAHVPAPCWASLCGDTLHLRFQQPQRALTPGQSVVLYEGDKVLGGGIIRHNGLQ